MRGTPGFLQLITGIGKPRLPRLGADVAGEVEAAGGAVTLFKPRDAVYGTCRGAFAQFACAASSTLAIKPRTLTFEQAAAVPIAGLTALQALRDKAHVQPGQRVLINGAAGGVGTFAVQIAKFFGAEVTGVCSGRNVEMVRTLGANHVIDYTREDFTRGSQHYDAILECVGNHSYSESRHVLNKGGVHVGIGGGVPDTKSMVLLAGMIKNMVLSWFASEKMAGVLAKSNTADLNMLNELMTAGKVTPVIDLQYKLTEVPEAIRYVEAGHARGKVVIVVNG
jgi:NADPH:quinone reductase-like Zn-dependent oxidoreductase